MPVFPASLAGKAAQVPDPGSVNWMSPSEILHLEQMIQKGRDTEELFLEATNMAAPLASGDSG